MPSEVVPYIHSLCEIEGIKGADIDGTMSTVDIRAVTALKRDGSVTTGVTRKCAER